MKRRTLQPDGGQAQNQSRDQTSVSDQSGFCQSEFFSEERKSDRTQNTENRRNADQRSEHRLGDALTHAEPVGDVVEAEDCHVQKGQADACVAYRVAHVRFPRLESVDHRRPNGLKQLFDIDAAF